MSEKRDLKNNLASDLTYFSEILANGTTTSSILDTAHYDSGIMYNFSANNFGDGTYTFILYESDDSAMSGRTVVADANIIGSLSSIILAAEVTNGSQLSTIGVIGTKRYLQMDVVAASVTTGANIFASINKVPEYLPVS